MIPLEMYKHLTERIDQKDPIVIEEIRFGIREPAGYPDIFHHMPRLREASHGNVLEIGVRHGASTCALLVGVEEHGGHVYSVDIEDCSRLFYGHPQWTFIQSDSRMVRAIMSVIPKYLDLLFIDGDHTWGGVFSDLTNYGPFANKIMLHDADAANSPQIIQASRDYLDQSVRHRSLVIYEDSHGLAVIE
jgi:methyltransferase family protein